MGPPSFNGGRGRRSCRERPPWRDFNGASVFQRRKVLASHRGRSLPRDFNGASVFQRRKGRTSPAGALRCRALQWGLRLSTEEGAEAEVPKNSPYLLQWGLRLSTEEGAILLAMEAALLVTSMGPPSFNGGRRAPPCTRRPGRKTSMGPPSFNGGRVVISLARSRCNCQLQWGLRLSTEEGPPVRSRYRRAAGASMGPPSFNGGRSLHPSNRLIGTNCFNGASVFQRRKGRHQTAPGGRSLKLQWGLRLSTEEGRRSSFR